jgi:hypothetical protein
VGLLLRNNKKVSHIFYTHTLLKDYCPPTFGTYVINGQIKRNLSTTCTVQKK